MTLHTSDRSGTVRRDEAGSDPILRDAPGPGWREVAGGGTNSGAAWDSAVTCPPSTAFVGGWAVFRRLGLPSSG